MNTNEILDEPMLAAADAAAITLLTERLQDAWACGDGAAYGSLFMPDARYVEATGFRAKGAKMIAERHQKVFDTIFKFSTIGGKYFSERQTLTPDIVLIHSEGNVLFPGESWEKLKPNGLVTMCLLKRNGEWKIASFHNTPTGKFRKIKFIFRFFLSRRFMFSAAWKKAKDPI
jgi:uncharacterized protein (TIGR02246 family)